MPANLQTSSEPSLTSIVSGIINDAQDLFKQQMALFRTELAADIQKTKEGAVLLAIGLCSLAIGVVLLSFGLVYLLSWLVPTCPLWVFYLLVGGAGAILGGGLTLLGWKQFQSVNADQSVRALQENLEWRTKPK
jgi:hypothetical protein